MKGKGMTLVELLIAMVVLGVLAMAAVPAFQSMLDDYRRRTVANEFLQALKTARTQAVIRHVPVVLRSHPRGWGWGWDIMLDSRHRRSERADLLYKHKLSNRPRMEANQWLRQEVRFDSLGAVTGYNGVAHPGTLYLCDPKYHVTHLRIIVSWTGRARIAEGFLRERDDLCRKTR